MARTIAQIQESIIAAKNADPTIGTGGTDPLSSTSAVAVWLLWTWIVATCMWVTESLYDAFTANVNSIIAATLPHTLNWYVTVAKAFQYGYALPAGSGVYATIDPAAQVVNFAAAVENLPFLRIKVATLAGGVLAPLSGAQLTAFTAYMNNVKDAGVPLNCTSGAADNLRVALNVYYDPQVLSATGVRLDGTEATPVQDAINVFIANLPFNGIFVLDSLIGALQAVPGVKIAQVTYCAAQYAALPYSAIAAFYVPDAGYMVLDGAYFTANTIYTSYGVV